MRKFHSPASGVLSARLVEDGVTVTEGAVIARLDVVTAAVAPSTTPTTSAQGVEVGAAGDGA